MAYEQNPNSGSIFRNTEKQSDTHPDYSGSLDVGGVAYWVNGWVKTSQNGKKYLSLSVKPKQQASTAPSGKTRREDMQDEVVF
jgi:uncharacterized protein (DUF736 family)